MDNKDFFTIEHDNIKKEYELNNYNREIAIKYIKLALNIIEQLKNTGKIPLDINYDIKNIIYESYNKDTNEKKLITYLYYYSLSSKGKMPKNKCRLEFEILLDNLSKLSNNVFNEDRDATIYSQNKISGYIIFSNDNLVNAAKIDIMIGEVIYRIETNSLYINNMDEIKVESLKRYSKSSLSGTLDASKFIEQLKQLIDEYKS